MASSLATALGVVSFSMEKRVAEEVRKYGANLVIIPETARLNVGSGGLNFGEISEPAYLEQRQVEDVLARSGLKAEKSFHLRGALRFQEGRHHGGRRGFCRDSPPVSLVADQGQLAG